MNVIFSYLSVLLQIIYAIECLVNLGKFEVLTLIIPFSNYISFFKLITSVKDIYNCMVIIGKCSYWKMASLQRRQR